MEEVDKIIIHSLRQIGCDIDEDITHLAQFHTELTVQAAVKCLEIIKPGLGLSPVLPANMAARFRMGADLAQACAELGYRGDIGYQTFLYSAEADLRRVLIFLIEKLPKESDKTVSEPMTKSAQLEKLTSAAISSQISVPWLPHYCHKKRFKSSSKIVTPFNAVNLHSLEEEESEANQLYITKYKPFLVQQIPRSKAFVPSIIALNSSLQHVPLTTTDQKIEWLNSQEYDKILDVPENDLYSLGRLISGVSLRSKKGSADDSTTEESEEVKAVTAEQTEFDELDAECQELEETLEKLQAETKQVMAEVSEAKVVAEQTTKELAVLEKESKIEIKAFELLENGEENIKKIEEAIEASVNKLISLANQWEKHRLPLIEEYREKKENYASTASASQKKLDELRMLRSKEKELLEEIRSKDQQYSQLVAEVQKLPKEVNRSGYTQRILEIINNVRKQKNEIDKILNDTRELQKEINTLNGKLERSFAVVDELIFRDARTNETSRRAYKLLATLHSDCSEIVKLVQETGAIVREIRDLEEQVDSESAKNVEANLERITADLKQMRQETASLKAQLQSKNS